MKPGRFMARYAQPSYQSSMAWNFALNARSKRAKKPVFLFSWSPSSSCTLMNLAQKSGTTVMAKKYDAKMERTTPSASGVKMYLLTPWKKVTGKNTMEVVKVAASTAIDTSSPPFSAATKARSPLFHVAEDVFEHDDAVVDEPREHQR